MKPKPYVLWLTVAAVALVAWLVWPSGKIPSGGQPIPNLATPLPSPASSAVAVAAGNQTPVPLPSATVAAPAVAPLGGAPLTSSGPTVSQANGTPVAALNPGDPSAPNQAAQIDVGRVRHMISDYHTLMGENPVGTNAEIMKQMTGGNARQATLGPPDGISLNAQGELVDQWGTAYFFHQLSRDKMEIRSAGPDKVMWTADDVTAR